MSRTQEARDPSNFQSCKKVNLILISWRVTTTLLRIGFINKYSIKFENSRNKAKKSFWGAKFSFKRSRILYINPKKKVILNKDQLYPLKHKKIWKAVIKVKVQRNSTKVKNLKLLFLVCRSSWIYSDKELTLRLNATHFNF
jgi:hypothetical protein